MHLQILIIFTTLWSSFLSNAAGEVEVTGFQKNKLLAEDEAVVPSYPQYVERDEEEIYERALKKGKGLLEMMRNPEDCMTTRWSQYNELKNYGWTVAADTGLGPLSLFLEEELLALDLHPGSAKVFFCFNRGNNRYARTDGYYENAYSIEHGYLIAIDTKNPGRSSPISPLGRTTTPLQHWSDVTFLVWQQLAEQKGNPELVKGLKVVFRQMIVNYYTSSVMEFIKDRKNAQYIPEFKDRWTFPMDSDEAKALLGTPNGLGVAFLLFQHKEQLGHKVVKQISMWQTNAGQHLMLEIEDLSQEETAEEPAPEEQTPGEETSGEQKPGGETSGEQTPVQSGQT